MKLKRAEEERNGLEFVRCKRSFGRKRILILNNDVDLLPTIPFKNAKMTLENESKANRSHLESLPQDVLIRVICGVSHDDLKQLLLLSKTISGAALIAKKLHFEYSTPKKIRAFRCLVDFENPNELDEIEAPSGPKHPRSYRSRLSKKSLAGISVALFKEE
ncbi:hypothetical protein K2173_020619 [Erythroxylum novogranatense]|uniref:F-box domain-containing protein n=1 Tax=Erythroxylum novogranatense TaxID=1862640 RepID=A0AAV8TIN6_9ROSI|nr:hypothetical protein K2173_020619 [Erythroxylum novogranatense]